MRLEFEVALKAIQGNFSTERGYMVHFWSVSRTMDQEYSDVNVYRIHLGYFGRFKAATILIYSWLRERISHSRQRPEYCFASLKTFQISPAC